MRTVACGTKEEGTGTGPAEVDNGRETAGGIPVSRAGNWIRTVACGFRFESGGCPRGGPGNWMRIVSFFGWSVSAMSVREIEGKSLICHYLMSKA